MILPQHEWYHQAKLHIVKVRRTISSNILNRNKVNELLALYKDNPRYKTKIELLDK